MQLANLCPDLRHLPATTRQMTLHVTYYPDNPKDIGVRNKNVLLALLVEETFGRMNTMATQSMSVS